VAPVAATCHALAVAAVAGSENGSRWVPLSWTGPGLLLPTAASALMAVSAVVVRSAVPLAAAAEMQAAAAAAAESCWMAGRDTSDAETRCVKT
jgi:organic hydroperoxide reductase OsmC/OhrA